MIYDVLIVDDETELAETTRDYLNAIGLKSAFVTGKSDFFTVFSQNQIRLVLLDINLKNESGYDICRAVREKSNIPIIFISVRTDDYDKIIALGIGGDDFVEKPYSLSVLAAKIHATLRRSRLSYESDEVIRIDHIEIEIKSRTVKVNEIIQELTVKEFELLVYLIKHKNEVIAKDKLYKEIWGENSMGETGTLTVHVRKLREKIEPDPGHPRYLKTIWAVGYLFEAAHEK